jgi:hypothetical protein
MVPRENEMSEGPAPRTALTENETLARSPETDAKRTGPGDAPDRRGSRAARTVPA